MKDVITRDITISNGKANASNALFCRCTTSSGGAVYKAIKVELNEEGEIEVEAVSHPVNDQGYSLYSVGFDDPSNWEIEGAI